MMKAIIIRFISSIIVAFLVLACNVNRKYTRSELNIPESYRGHQVTGDTTLLSWRTFFKDPLLVDLIDQALKKNNDVATGVLTVRQTELAYNQARLGLLPVFDATLGANRTWLSTNSLNGSLSDQFLGTNYLDDYSATLRLSWEVDIWRKARMQKEASLADYFTQKDNLAALKTRIVVQVAQAYYNLLALDEQLRVAQRNVELGDSTLNMIRLQYASAYVNSLALGQAEAQKKTAELLIPLAMQNIVVQENALSILTGDYPDSITRSGHLSDSLMAHVFPGGVPAALVSRRPDVRAAEYVIVAANARAGLAKAAMYPSISITPSIGANSFRFDSWFDLPGSMVKNLGANLAQPIFQKKALRTNYQIAQLEQEKAATVFKQTVMIAVGEVSDALVRSKYSDERLMLVEDKTASLTKATKDATLLYKSGMATYLEVITAQNTALQNELEAVAIKRDKLNAMTDLYRALGGGVDN